MDAPSVKKHPIIRPMDPEQPRYDLKDAEKRDKEKKTKDSKKQKKDPELKAKKKAAKAFDIGKAQKKYLKMEMKA